MKKLNLPAYTSLDTVKWPSHFIGENGIVLASGAFDKDEAPFGSGACAICTCGAPLAGAPPASTCGPADLAAYKPEVPHILDPEHQMARQRMCKVYVCFWQELTAPDGRPYYYDHISNTWKFSKPMHFAIEIGVDVDASPLQKAAAAALHSNVDPDNVAARLVQALKSPLPDGPPVVAVVADGATTDVAVDGDGGNNHYCKYCKKYFNDPWSLEQHTSALAGRKGHPRPQGATEQKEPGEQSETQQVPEVCANPWSSAQTQQAVQQQPQQASVSSSAVHAANQSFIAELDIIRTDQAGKTYWYNPKTRASAWTAEELIKMNHDFYAGVCIVKAAPGQRGPMGQTSWFVRLGSSGKQQHQAWTLEELYELCQQD